MKKYSHILKIFFTTVLILGGSALVAHAEGNALDGITKLFGLNMWDFAAEIIAISMNWLIAGMSFAVAIAGFLLNFSINLTIHVKDFVDSTPAIFTTWKAIRDISGMFIIFFLLWAAIQLILGLKGAGFGNLIKNIIIAGVLVNFSFFFAGLGIDASNIISVQLYNAIAPANSLNSNNGAVSVQDGVKNTLRDGGLSDVFMNSLKITDIYKGSLVGNQKTSTGQVLSGGTGAESSVGAPLKVFLSGIVAIMIELTAALSFLIASFAFIARFVVLLMLLAFSPVWFISHIIPMTAEYAKKWISAYKAMLLFMPVYLMLMYLALSVLTTTPLFGAINSSGTVGDGAWYSGLLVLGVNSVIVMFLLNMPLIVAASIAQTGIPVIDKLVGNVLEGATNVVGARAMWTRFSSQTGKRTLGRAAYAVGQSNTFKAMASKSPIVGSIASAGLSSVTSAGFGAGKSGSYEAQLKARNTAKAGLNKKIGEVDKTRFDNVTKDGNGKTEADREVDKAKTYQEKYRQNLPWKNAFTGKPGGVIGFLVDNRANRQTAAKLSAEAKKESDKKAKEEAEKRIKEIAKLKKFHTDPMTVTMGSNEIVKKLDEEEEKLRDVIDKGKAVEKEEENKKIMDKLDEIEKKEDKSGGGK